MLRWLMRKQLEKFAKTFDYDVGVFDAQVFLHPHPARLRRRTPSDVAGYRGRDRVPVKIPRGGDGPPRRKPNSGRRDP